MSKPDCRPFRNPVVAALDVDTRDEALRLADQLADVIGGLKLGPRLCLRYGQDLVREIAARAPVFMDNKHFDIPSTMEAAVRASFEAGASVVTVHALSGPEALRAMAAVEKELNQKRSFRILAVTILTSWDENSLPPVMKPGRIADQVKALAGHVSQNGLKSLVCSPHELEFLRDQGFFLLTPGIRLAEDAHGDQKRVAGPAEALRDGASALVVGRPIVRAEDPRAATLKFLDACK
ncbi:MAG: orotidine-5'-phosphate decarboxylase [Bdellovibrionaceae bacterium]|nr:orotidine-5'-phosphate decarboxylase [Pseudobdellovibrionaceae bacterium]